MDLILASTSPQKKSLMNKLGLVFHTMDPEFDESKLDYSKKADTIVKEAAHSKAENVAKDNPEKNVIAHHMVAVVDGESIKRPLDPKEAEKVLNKLSGKDHEVHGAIVIRKGDKIIYEGVQKTVVTFKKLNKKDVKEYASSEEPVGMIAGYAVMGDGGMFIENIDGSYFNIVGFPLKMLMNGLAKIGINIEDGIKNTIDLQEKSIKESFPR